MAESAKRGRGRPPGSKKVQGGPTPGAGHNQMTDDQEQKLTRDHAAKRALLLAAEVKAKSDRMNFDKIIKSDLGAKGLDNIKLLERLEADDKGENSVKEDFERMAKVARWAGLQIGTQGSLFDDDRRSTTEKAFDEGKKAGMTSKDPNSPYTGEAGQEWLRGWHEGQAIQAQKFMKPGPEAAEIVTTSDQSSKVKPDDFDKAASASEGKAWPDDAQAEANASKH
jgi:ribosome modulation factor